MSAENNPERNPLLHRNMNIRRSRRPCVSRQPSLVSQPPSPSTASASSQQQFRTRAAGGAILLSLVFERAAFYGLAGNLVLFLNKKPLFWQTYNAIDASLYFFGLCFVMSLVGGWLADSVLGRFKAILISFVIYIGGYLLMPFLAEYSSPFQACWGGNSTRSSTDENDSDMFEENCSWLIFIALTAIAVGTGFVKASIAPFGSDQVTMDGQQTTLSFFNWFYWCLNLGALLGLSVITYLEQQHNFLLGYLVSLCCLGMSTLLFAAGRCFYHVKEPDGSILTNIFRIIREACRRKRQRKLSQAARRRNRPSEVDSANSTELCIGFLDHAKHRHGGLFHDTLVEDVKRLKKIVAVFAVLVPYWLVYFQMQTSFLVQGLHMRLGRPFTRHVLNFTGTPVVMKNATPITEPPQVVAAWLSLFDVVVLVLLLPLFDRVIYPWLERRSGVPVSISRRIFLGMVFAIAAMVVAGLVEHFRLEVFWDFNDTSCLNASISQIIDGTEYQAADMSILWQIPQYVLIGLSEVFTSVAGLQFAVCVAPRSMKGIIMGLFYLFSGIGSILGTAVVAGLSSAKVWFLAPDFGNINCRRWCSTGHQKSCHLDYYFYLLAGVEVVGAALFLLVARVHRLDQHHRSCRDAAIHLPHTSGNFSHPPPVRVPVSDQDESDGAVQTIQRSPSQDGGCN